MYFPARVSRFATNLLLSLSLGLSACDPPAPATEQKEATESVAVATTGNPLTVEDQQQLEQFRKTAGSLPHALMECSGKLQASTQALLKQVSADNLQLLRTRLERCQEIYLATTTLRGFNPQQQARLQQLHSQLGKPLTMPGFIDSIEGYPFSGIVNDATLELSEAALREQQGLTHDAEVSIGFAVVRFLVWGEHSNHKEIAPRPFSDFNAVRQWPDSSEELPVSAHPNNRRRSLLQLTVDILHQDCVDLRNTWDSGNLPASHELARQWKIQQLQALINGLEQWPDNQILAQTLRDWLQQGAFPTAESKPDPTLPLRAQLESRLNQLVKAQG